MPAGQAEEVIALALVFAVHVVGGAALVWALFDAEQRDGWRRRWGRGGGDDGRDPPPPPPPRGPGGRARLPLEHTARSRVRLREPGRLAAAHPRPARRPRHAPEPSPDPAPKRPPARRR